MRINRKVGGAIAVAAAGLVAAAVSMPQAQAQTTLAGYNSDVQRTAVQSLRSDGLSTSQALHRLAVQMDSKVLANTLTDRLGSRSADYYLDRSGHAVVNVLDAGSAQQVRAAGATPKQVRYSSAELRSVQAKLQERKRVPNSTLGLDPRTNQVVVTISDAAPTASAAGLTSYAKTFGDRVRVEHSTGVLRPAVAGGDAITGGGSRCSAGFNGTQGGQNVIVTAGHCTGAVSNWDGVGPSVGSSFPGNDYGLIRNDSGNAPNTVDLYNGSAQTITGSGDAGVGESVCKSGSTTGLTCGSVEQLNVTVNYQQGAVYGTIMHSAHCEPGDSGGSLFDGGTALGMTSGTDGTNTYSFPVNPALQAYGVALK